MFSLTRASFPDRLLNYDDLDDIGDLWLAWHKEERDADGLHVYSYHALCLRLWGFPRPDADDLADLLEERLAPKRGWSVELDDPDDLSADSDFRPLTEPLSLSGALKLVQDPVFIGLVLFLELSIYDWPGESEGDARAGGTLVVCGEIRRDGFLLKAIWPAGLVAGVENLYKFTVWTHQDAFLDALDNFRRGEITEAPEKLFEIRATQRSKSSSVKTIIHIPSLHSARDGRLRSFLYRTAYHLLCLTVWALLFVLGPNWLLKKILCIGMGLYHLSILGYYVVGNEVWRVWTFYRRMKASLKRIYSIPLETEPVTLAQFGADLGPSVTKYTAELVSLGCQHLGDIRLKMGNEGKSFIRIFVLPAERMYVNMMVMITTGTFQLFPAKVHYLVVNYLTDGRISTINEGGGYRRTLTPNVFGRRCPDIHDPAELIAKHRKFVAEILAQGHTPAPLFDLPALLKRMQQDHEEIRPRMEKWGYYSLPAAFRQNFEIVRKEYLEPKE